MSSPLYNKWSNLEGDRIMKCIVTGGAGFIGSHIVDRLIDDGHKVIIIDDLSTGKEENINPKAEFLSACITFPPIVGICFNFVTWISSKLIIPISLSSSLRRLHTL